MAVTWMRGAGSTRSRETLWSAETATVSITADQASDEGPQKRRHMEEVGGKAAYSNSPVPGLDD